VLSVEEIGLQQQDRDKDLRPIQKNPVHVLLLKATESSTKKTSDNTIENI